MNHTGVHCKLKEILDSREIGMSAFSVATGLSQATVGKYYKNQCDRYDVIVLCKMANYLELERLDELIEFK
jgi:hypothetical protein